MLPYILSFGVFKKGGCKMVLADNIKYMNLLPDKSVKLALPYPNYGIGESSKNHKSRNTAIRQKNGKSLKAKDPNYKKKNWDDLPPDYVFFKQLFRVSENQIIWGANYFLEIVGETFKPPRRSDYENFIAKNPVGWIIWDKVNGGNDFNDCELAWTSFDRPSVVIYYLWHGMRQGLTVSYDISKANFQIGNKKLNEKRINPCQKPIKIYDWLYETYSNPGDIVLDSNFGSCNSGISAYHHNLFYIGIENDMDEFDSGTKNFNLKTIQKAIF